MKQGFDWLLHEEPEVQDRFVRSLNQIERDEYDYHWSLQARKAQLPPPGSWRNWLIMAGRGFGKTRAGAEWVRMVAENNANARIALVTASLSEARAVMVEGESGLLACPPAGGAPRVRSLLAARAIPQRGYRAAIFGRRTRSITRPAA